VELTREIARRFNHVFGRESGFEEKAQEAVKKLGGKRARLYSDLRDRFQEKGDEGALEQAKALVQEANQWHQSRRDPQAIASRAQASFSHLHVAGTILSLFEEIGAAAK